MVYWARTDQERCVFSLALRPVNVLLIMFQSTFLQSIIECDIVGGEAEPSKMNAVDFLVASAKAKVALLEAYTEELSIADDVDESALDPTYEELEEMEPSTKPKRAVCCTVSASCKR